MNYQFIELIISYYLDNNELKKIQSLKLLNNDFKNIINLNTLFKRKKSAYLLNICMKNIVKNYNGNIYLLKYDKIFCHEWLFEYKCLLNNIFDDAYCCKNIAYELYLKNFESYKQDKLDPLKRLRLFKYYDYKFRCESSMIFSMALHHAEKQYSYNKSRELEDYYFKYF